MAVNVTGGALDFTASIDTSDFDTQVANIENDLQGVVAESVKLAQSLETIRGKIYARKDLLLTETDIAKIKQYNQEIQALEKEFLRISNIGKSGFDDTGNAIIKQLGLIDQLRAKISGYNASIGAAQSTGEIGPLVAELQAAEAELTKLTNIGKEGFDALGNAIIEPTGLMEALILKANDLHLAIVKATSPEEVAVLNAELETTNAELSKLRNAGTDGFDGLGNKLVVEAGLLDQLRIKAAQLRTSIGAATSPEQIAAFNAELEVTNAEMTRLTNAGRTGFDSLGNPIEEVTRKSNLLGKAWGFLRQAAFILPGIGIAGIFNVIGIAVASLVEAIMNGSKSLDKFKDAWKALNDVVAEANKTAGSQIADLKILYSAATNVNLSMEERLKAVKALKQEFPDYFSKINDEIILNGQSQKAYEDLTAAIIASSRAAAAKAKLDDIERQKLDIDFQRQKVVNATAKAVQQAQATPDQIAATSNGAFVSAGSSLEEAQANARRKAVKALNDLDTKENALAYQEKYLIAFAGEKNITDTVIKENDKRVKKTKETDKDLNELLRNRISLQQQIAKLEIGSNQSGLLKDDGELEKVRQKYQDVFDVIDALNKKIEEYNSKHTKKIATISTDEIDKLKAAENTELQNKQYEIDANNYKESLSVKKKIYDEFQQEVNEVGIAKASELYKDDLAGFTNYIDYLKAELTKLDGKTDKGSNLKRDDINKALTDATDSQKQQQVKDFNEAYKAAQTYNQKLQAIDVIYFKQKQALSTKYSGEELRQMLKNLDDNKQASIDAAKDEVFKKTAIYQQLNETVIELSKKQVKEQIAAIQELLSKGVDIPDELKTSLQKKLTDLQDSLNFTPKQNFIKGLEDQKAAIEKAFKSGTLSTD
jgi:hypothetical protein